ncbi:MAG: hypothetical protein AB1486_06155 [Planctomycetota bacterium]
MTPTKRWTPPHPGTRSLELTLEADGTSVRLLSKRSIEMIPPPSDPLDGWSGGTGSWFVLEDERGEPLYRRIIQNPLRNDVEVYGERPGETYRAVPPHALATRQTSRRFWLLAPDIEGAHAVVLYGSSAALAGAVRGPSIELARVQLGA